jgi:hypothetical protein
LLASNCRAAAPEGLSRLLNSFPPALQPIAAGELAIPVPVGVEVVSWAPVAVGDSVAGFVKAAHGGSLALRSFSSENNRSGGAPIPEDVIAELRCQNSDLAEKYKLDVSELDRQIGRYDLTHIKRTFCVDKLKFVMETGHAYYREHLGGDLRGIGSLNEIESCIIKHLLKPETMAKLIEGHSKIDIDFKGIVLQYKVFKKGDFLSIDYYPKK